MVEQVRDRLARVYERIAQAAERAGRKAEDIKLIAVSKTFNAEIVQGAVDAGVVDLGENKVQEAAGKIPQIRADRLRWHLIGHLQSNKVRTAVTLFDVIHTVDDAQLVERIDRIAGEAGRRPTLLVQVDLAHEPTKSGAREAKLPEIVEALGKCRNIEFRGLMALPPFFDAPEQTRVYFRRLRELRDALNRELGPERRLTELSMGMSHDFEVAIEEGATMIRVGTAIFGER